MRTLLVVVIVALAVAPALASLPGQPLDCSDWVFLVPGLSCSNIARPCTDELFCGGGFSLALDNEGRQYRLRNTNFDLCGTATFMVRHELVRFDGSQSEVVAYVDDRCLGGAQNPADYDQVELFNFLFDKERGRMIVSGQVVSSRSNYVTIKWLLALEGFPTTFEILQTFTPTASELSFRAPYMPEGHQFADRFDTYVGDLATVGDWSQLQPLQCAYPVAAPSVGDYLTVADTTPTPTLGQGLYFVTAATFQGETRFGRRSIGGVLSGRNPTELPLCSE